MLWVWMFPISTLLSCNQCSAMGEQKALGLLSFSVSWVYHSQADFNTCLCSVQVPFKSRKKKTALVQYCPPDLLKAWVPNTNILPMKFRLCLSKQKCRSMRKTLLWPLVLSFVFCKVSSRSQIWHYYPDLHSNWDLRLFKGKNGSVTSLLTCPPSG